MPSRSTTEYAGLDFLRIAGAVAVILIHAAGGTVLSEYTAFTRFAVPFFASSAAFLAYLSGARSSSKSITSYARARFSRLYVPFLVWTAIYIALRSFGGAIGDVSHLELGIYTLWTGSANHLWFLPFVLFVTCISFAAGKLACSRTGAMAVIASCLVLALMAFLRQPDLSWGYTLRLALANAPTVLIAIALAAADHQWALTARAGSAGAVLAAIGFFVLLALLTIFGRDRIWENLAGTTSLLLGLTWMRGQRYPWLALLSSFTYGIYLSHIMFVEGAEDLLALVGVSYAPLVASLVFVLSIVLALVFCLVCSGYRWSMYLGLPGDKPGEQFRTTRGA